MIYTNPNIRASSRDGYVIATFIADTVAELPPLNYLTDYTLEIGSTCHVIEDSGDYEMQSDGTWVKRIPAVLANTYTRTEIDSKIANVNSDIDILAGLQGTDRQIIIDMINSGAKNIFTTTATSQTVTDITFTNNNDGTWTVNGTAAARRQKALAFTVDAALVSGDYVLSGCPSGGVVGSNIVYCLYLWDLTDNVRISQNDTGNGVVFNWIPDPTHTYQIVIDIRGGTTANNLMFSPMITPQIIYNATPDFRPYCPTLQQLYAMVQSYHGGA